MDEHNTGQDDEEPDKRSQQNDNDARDGMDTGEPEDAADDDEYSNPGLAQAYVDFVGRGDKRLQDAFAPFATGYSERLGSLAKDIIGKDAMSAFHALPEGSKLQPDFETMKAPRPPQPEPLDFEIAHNPAHDVLEEALKTNALLAAMVDQAKADAQEQRKDAADSKRHAESSIKAAWVAVVVTALIGLAGIGVSVLFGVVGIVQAALG